MIFKYRLDQTHGPWGLLRVCGSLRVVYSILVECFHVFVDISQYTVQVEHY